MSYLRFEKTLMTNLEESLQKEILRTNRSGAYHCSTIVDCNTRKYHGLLVIPIPELDDENHVLKLKQFANTLNNVERIELLPYHSMAKSKYNEMNLKYRLEPILRLMQVLFVKN